MSDYVICEKEKSLKIIISASAIRFNQIDPACFLPNRISIHCGNWLPLKRKVFVYRKFLKCESNYLLKFQNNKNKKNCHKMHFLKTCWNNSFAAINNSLEIDQFYSIKIINIYFEKINLSNFQRSIQINHKYFKHFLIALSFFKQYFVASFTKRHKKNFVDALFF